MTDFQKMWEEYGVWLMKMADDTDMEPIQNYTYEACLDMFLKIYSCNATTTDSEFNKAVREIKKRLEWT